MQTKDPKTTYTIVNQDAVQVLYPLKQHNKFKDLEVNTFKDVDMGQFLDDKDDPDDWDMLWNDDDDNFWDREDFDNPYNDEY